MLTFLLVEELHKKFDMPRPDKPSLLDKELLEFRIKFLREEIDEFKKAHEELNLEEAFDALLDLLYVVHGTLYFMGIDKEMLLCGFHEVHRANMKKVKVNNSNESKRKHHLDLKKPEGWKAPNHSKILNKDK